MLAGGCWPELDSLLKLLGRDSEWSLLIGGRYSEVVVNTGLTVLKCLRNVLEAAGEVV